MVYFWKRLIASESVAKVMLGLVAPAVGVTVASFCQSDVEISSRAIADVVYEFVGSACVVVIGMFAVLGLAEGEFTFMGSLELGQFMDAVFGEESSVVISDVGVPACSV